MFLFGEPKQNNIWMKNHLLRAGLYKSAISQAKFLISNQFDFTDNLSNLRKFSSSIGLNTTQPKKKILVIDNQICIGLTYFSPFADIRFTVLKTMLIQQLYKFAAFVAVYPAFIFTSLDVDSVRSASSAVLKRDVVSSDDQMTRDVQQKDILRRNPMFWNQFLTPHNKGS